MKRGGMLKKIILEKHLKYYGENDDLSEIATFGPAFVVRQSEFHNFVSDLERDVGSFH